VATVRDILAAVLPLLALLLIAIGLAVPVNARTLRAFAAVAALLVIVVLVIILTAVTG
jgi:hypothetical protein